MYKFWTWNCSASSAIQNKTQFHVHDSCKTHKSTKSNFGFIEKTMDLFLLAEKAANTYKFFKMSWYIFYLYGWRYFEPEIVLPVLQIKTKCNLTFAIFTRHTNQQRIDSQTLALLKKLFLLAEKAANISFSRCHGTSSENLSEKTFLISGQNLYKMGHSVPSQSLMGQFWSCVEEASQSFIRETGCSNSYI